jgi:hypothetical protein
MQFATVSYFLVVREGSSSGGAQAASLHISAACRDAFVPLVQNICFAKMQPASCRLAACAPQNESPRACFNSATMRIVVNAPDDP